MEARLPKCRGYPDTCLFDLRANRLRIFHPLRCACKSWIPFREAGFLFLVGRNDVSRRRGDNENPALYCISCARDRIVFDYGVVPSFLLPQECKVLKALQTRGLGHGEPWKILFDPTALMGILTSLGFSDVEDFGPERLNDRYFFVRDDGLRKGGVSRLIYVRIHRLPKSRCRIQDARCRIQCRYIPRGQDRGSKHIGSIPIPIPTPTSIVYPVCLRRKPWN